MKILSFWPYDEEGEIDVLIDFTEVVIGMGAFSSGDSIFNEKIYEEDTEQIMLESRQ